MATISNTPRPGYVWDSTDNVWYPIGVGGHSHSEIAKTIADAKGDLIVGTAADTVDRLAVGNNGETLVADSGATTGLRYQGTIAAGRNLCINGGMDIWQRGTTFTATANLTYLADRWFNSTGTSLTVTRDTDVPTSPYFQYSIKLVGSSDNSVSMRIESANSTLLAGQTVTMSFYAKRTSGTGALDVRFYYPSATDNFASVTQIGSTSVLSASPTSSWVRYQVSVAIGTNITTGLQILINNTGASTTFITGAQLEIGSVATNFSRAGGTVQGELAACQRYYVALPSGSASDNYATFATGYTVTSTKGNFVVNLPVPMRIYPTMTYSAGNTFATHTGASTVTAGTAIATDRSSPNTIWCNLTVASGLTAGNALFLIGNNTTSAKIEASAEL